MADGATAWIAVGGAKLGVSPIAMESLQAAGVIVPCSGDMGWPVGSSRSP